MIGMWGMVAHADLAHFWRPCGSGWNVCLTIVPPADPAATGILWRGRVAPGGAKFVPCLPTIRRTRRNITPAFCASAVHPAWTLRATIDATPMSACVGAFGFTLLRRLDQPLGRQQRIDPAAQHHLQQLRRDNLHGQRLRGARIAYGPGLERQLRGVAFLERGGNTRTFAGQQSVTIDCIAEEQPVDRLGQQEPDATTCATTAPPAADDPMPKLNPPTIASPCRTCLIHSGRFAWNTAVACSSALRYKYGPGSIRSVLMLSPNFQTLPDLIRRLPGRIRRRW